MSDNGVKSFSLGKELAQWLDIYADKQSGSGS